MGKMPRRKSTELIEGGNYLLEMDLNTVFMSTSQEAIWQLMPISPGYNTLEGFFFIITAGPQYVVLDTVLVNGFRELDQLYVNWIGQYASEDEVYYFPYKYKVQQSEDVIECSMVLRFAEQYLIRAGARANRENISGAISDISNT